MIEGKAIGTETRDSPSLAIILPFTVCAIINVKMLKLCKRVVVFWFILGGSPLQTYKLLTQECLMPGLYAPRKVFGIL